MRVLFLFRHAKSSWDDPALADFDRPLGARGVRDAPRMGGELCGRGWFPQRALVSAARRTRDTWTLASDCLPSAFDSVFTEALYHAEPAAILSLIRSVPDAVTSLVVVGHNPGLEQFAALLVMPKSDAEALARLRAKFPTAALARFEYLGSWGDLAPGSARLTHFLTPKQLAAAPPPAVLPLGRSS